VTDVSSTVAVTLGDVQPFCNSGAGYSDNPLCICGDTQSMSHIINDCPVNKFEGGLAQLYTSLPILPESAGCAKFTA